MVFYKYRVLAHKFIPNSWQKTKKRGKKKFVFIYVETWSEAHKLAVKFKSCIERIPF